MAEEAVQAANNGRTAETNNSDIRSIIDSVMGEEQVSKMFDETAEETSDLEDLFSGEADNEEQDPGIDDKKDEDVPSDEETATQRIGVDEAFRIIKEQLPKGLSASVERAFKGMQQQWSQDRQKAGEVDALRSEMKAIVDEWKTVKAQAAEEAEEDGEEEGAVDEVAKAYEDMDDGSRKLFKYMLEKIGPEWAKSNGFILKGDIEREKIEDQVRTTHVKAVDTGIEKYGELFGNRDETGKYIPSEEAKAKMAEAYATLGGKEYKGTVLDLFEYAMRDKIIELQVERARNGNGTFQAIEKRKNSVAARTSTGISSTSFYKPKAGQRASVGDIAKRAAMHTMNEMLSSS